MCVRARRVGAAACRDLAPEPGHPSSRLKGRPRFFFQICDARPKTRENGESHQTSSGAEHTAARVRRPAALTTGAMTSIAATARPIALHRARPRAIRARSALTAGAGAVHRAGGGCCCFEDPRGKLLREKRARRASGEDGRAPADRASVVRLGDPVGIEDQPGARARRRDGGVRPVGPPRHHEGVVG